MATNLHSQSTVHSESEYGPNESLAPEIHLAENLERFEWLPDHYQVDQANSQKTFGQVSFHQFVALDSRTSRLVVISAISESFLDPSAKHQFLSNSKKLSTINSEAFLQPLDWGFQGGFAFIARAFQKDLPMFELFGCGATKFSTMEKLIAIRSVAKALVAVHGFGCVHRQFDSFQFIDQNSKFRLGCAGPLAYASSRHIKGEQAREFAETASPELAGSIDHDIGVPSDIYSLGIFMFRILAGSVPFSGADTNTILLEHMTRSPNWKALQNIPEPLIAIVKHSLSKDPSGRYQTSQSILDDLQSVINSVASNQPLPGFFPGSSDSRSTVLVPQFVGRQAELEEISQCISSFSTDRRKICVLGGAGLGKTRFVLEAIRRASGNSTLLFQANVSQEAGESPLEPAISVARQVLGFPDLAKRLEHELVDYKEELTQILPEFAHDVGWKPNLDEDFSGPKQLVPKRLTRALTLLIAKLGTEKQPAVLWIDNGQWLDGSMFNVLKELDAHRLRYTTIVLSMHAETIISPKALADRFGRTRTIELKPLSNNEIQSLIQSMAGRVPAKATELVTRIAAGIPFMASAVVRGLVETEAMFFEGGKWQIDDAKFEKAGASSDAAVLLTQRIETLPCNSADVLKLAATNGREFDQKTIVDISGLSAEAADEALAVLRQARLIWQRPDGRFTFVHNKIRDTTLELIPPKTQKSLHRRIADYTVQKLANGTLDADSHVNQKIAFHFHWAECADQGYTYAILAARNAKETFAIETAINFFKIAISGCSSENTKDNYQNYLDLAEVLTLSGQYSEANRWLERASQWAETSQEQAWINMKIGDLLFKKGDKEKSVENFEKALELLGCPAPKNNLILIYQLLREVFIQVAHSLFPKTFVGKHPNQPSKSLCMTWKSYGRLAHGYWYTRNLYWVLWGHLRCMNQAETYPPTEELAHVYSEHAPAMSLIPWASRGEAYAKRSLEIRENQNNLWGQGQTKGFLSILLYATSQFQKCVDTAQSAETILKQTGDLWEKNIANYQLAAAHMRLGNFKKAVEVSRSTYHLALKAGDFQATGNIIDVWVRASAHGLPAEVLSLEKSRLIRDSQTQCQILMAEGIDHFRTEDFQNSIKCFEQAIDLAKKNGVVNTYTSSNFVWLARAKRRQFFADPPISKQSTQRALRDCYRAAKKAVRLSKRFPNDLPHAYRELAIASALVGRRRKARKLIMLSIATARSQGAKFEHVLSLKTYGQLGAELGWKGADTALRNADEMLSQLDCEILADKKQVSMSLVERFDLLLDAGREIFSATDNEIILQTTADAAIRLLRARRVIILVPDSDSQADWKSLHGHQEYDHSLASETIKQNRSVINNEETLATSNETHTGTYLCSPIHVGDQVAALIYIANEYVTNCFGENEVRIADYLANAAGSAMEKANGFQQLAELNQVLEQKVLDRTESLQKQTNDLELTAKELREAQLKLESARFEAEQANQTKSDFLARMSHEIRTPISAVMGYTELILRGIVTDPADCRDKLETINSSGQHLLRLVNDLLDLSKIEADMLTIEIIECSPAKIAYDTFHTIASTAREKGIQFDLQFETSIPEKIQSDPTRLTQIMTNLVGNAVKFTTEGSVTIAVRTENIDEEQSLIIQIQDTGLGMTEEQASRIFDPFVQADTSTTRQFGGTGLGLSITKQLIELLGGELKVESEYGTGSTFTTSIPISCNDSELLAPADIEKMIQQRSTPSWLKGDLTGIHVLIVDDAPTNQELLSYLLTDSGATTTIAQNGQEAIDLISSDDSFDIVLMDMQMPVLGGSAATRILRSRSFDKPIIALTANSMKGDEEACIIAGCSAYMSKPIDTNLLLTTVCNFAQRAIQTTVNQPKSKLRKSQTNSSLEPSTAHDASTLSVELLESLPSEEPFRNLAIRFLHKAKEKMPEFLEASKERQSKKLKSLTHWMKGTAGSIQLTELSALAEEMENAVMADNWDDIQEPLTRMTNLMSCNQVAELV